MRTLNSIASLVMAALLAWSCYTLGAKSHPVDPPPVVMPLQVPLHLTEVPDAAPPPPVHHDSGPTLDQIRKLAELAVQRVEVADVQETSIDGRTGGVRVGVLVRGDFLLGVDLSQARWESKDPDRKFAVLVLPAPQASSPRVDHERTRVFDLSAYGLWQMVPGDAGRSAVLEHGLRHAQRVVEAAGADPTLIDKSRRDVETTLSSFFDALGWTVAVRWEDHPTTLPTSRPTAAGR